MTLYYPLFCNPKRGGCYGKKSIDFFSGPLSRSIYDLMANTLHHVIHIRQFCLPYINFKILSADLYRWTQKEIHADGVVTNKGSTAG